MKIKAPDIVLKALGLMLLTAAVLKAHELLTVPMANKDIWSYRPFLVFQVEFELALGIWLLSGAFKRFAWMVTLACFGLFCCVTLYKGLTGAASCGCFGTVHVNPWITLLAIDLPAIAALAVFRPQNMVLSISCFYGPILRIRRLIARGFGQSTSHFGLISKRVLGSLVSRRSVAMSVMVLLALSITTPILALNVPEPVTSTYEVLEPETWVGQELPILDYIDIRDQLREGNWLVTLYHHDCPDCAGAIPMYEQMARDLQGNEDFLRIALIEVPPYGQEATSEGSSCLLGKMNESKEWFVTTPATVMLAQGVIKAGWEGDIPHFEAIMQAVYDTSGAESIVSLN